MTSLMLLTTSASLWDSGRKLHRYFVEDTPERSDEDVVGDDVGVEAVEVAHVVQPVVPSPVVVGPDCKPTTTVPCGDPVLLP